jgi:hypothetical protein
MSIDLLRSCLGIGLETDPSGFDGRRLHALADGIKARPNLSIMPAHFP